MDARTQALAQDLVRKYPSVFPGYKAAQEEGTVIPAWRKALPYLAGGAIGAAGAGGLAYLATPQEKEYDKATGEVKTTRRISPALAAALLGGVGGAAIPATLGTLEVEEPSRLGRHIKGTILGGFLGSVPKRVRDSYTHAFMGMNRSSTPSRGAIDPRAKAFRDGTVGIGTSRTRDLKKPWNSIFRRLRDVLIDRPGERQATIYWNSPTYYNRANNVAASGATSNTSSFFRGPKKDAGEGIRIGSRLNLLAPLVGAALGNTRIPMDAADLIAGGAYAAR